LAFLVSLGSSLKKGEADKKWHCFCCSNERGVFSGHWPGQQSATAGSKTNTV